MRAPEAKSQPLLSNTNVKAKRSFEDQQNGSYESSESGKATATTVSSATKGSKLRSTNVSDMMAKTQNKRMQEMLARYQSSLPTFA